MVIGVPGWCSPVTVKYRSFVVHFHPASSVAARWQAPLNPDMEPTAARGEFCIGINLVDNRLCPIFDIAGLQITALVQIYGNVGWSDYTSYSVVIGGRF
jgi:hypothetical protein